jgi:3-deoxy-D-manno-octulosonic-acid transferase
LSANSFRGYRRFRWLIGGSFKKIAMIAAQNETYAKRFRKLGCDPSNVIVTGSVKFDGVETNRANARTLALAQLAEIGEHDQVFVAGSTQIEEDLIAGRVYQQLRQSHPNLRLILVPRHPERCGALASQLKQLGIPSVLRSSLDSRADQTGDLDSNPEPPRGKTSFESTIRPAFIVDVIGELGAWWGCADVTYVGGSLGRRGGQNMIEPAGFGLPVSFGPNTENFREIVQELLAHCAAEAIHDEATLRAFVERVLYQPDSAAEMGIRAKNVVMNHLGASHRTVEVLSAAMEESFGSSDCDGDASTRAA